VNVLWVRIREAIAGTLDAMTLADLVPSAFVTLEGAGVRRPGALERSGEPIGA
jgi:hypothetical protein